MWRAERNARISTHTPLARRDIFGWGGLHGAPDISTHTPLARRDEETIRHCDDLIISTHTPLARRDRH